MGVSKPIIAGDPIALPKNRTKPSAFIRRACFEIAGARL